MDFDGIRRSGKLYDRQHHTYKWTDVTPVQCDVVWEFDWVDLPQPIQDFIVARTATFAIREALFFINEGTRSISFWTPLAV